MGQDLLRSEMSRAAGSPKLLSFCIPTFNRAKYLEQTLGSILPQVGTDIEVVVSDNCSTDGTEEMMRSYLEKYPCIRYSSNEANLGPDRNLLRCVERATGEYVWFFGSDDLLREGAVEAVRQRITGGASRPTLIYLNHEIIDNQGQMLIKSKIGCEEDREFTDARACVAQLGLNLGFLAAVVLRRDLCLQAARNEDFVGSRWNHFHLVLCSLLAGGSVQYVGRPLVQARRSLSTEYDHTEQFVKQVNRIFWDVHQRGYPWLTIYRAMNHTVREYYARFVLAWRCDAPEKLARSFPVLLRTCWKYPWFWLLVVPLWFTPRRLAVALRKRLRSLRSWRNARQIQRLEESTSRQAILPSRSVASPRTVSAARRG